MSCAKLIRLAEPFERRFSRWQSKRGLRCSRLNPDQGLGNLGLQWMGRRLKSEQPNQVLRSYGLELGFPAERCGGKTQCCQRMPEIVLAIAESAFPVLP